MAVATQSFDKEGYNTTRNTKTYNNITYTTQMPILQMVTEN